MHPLDLGSQHTQTGDISRRSRAYTQYSAQTGRGAQTAADIFEQLALMDMARIHITGAFNRSGQLAYAHG